ncbi:hypothetical protein [Idiomarina abyssalis]|uniref:Uncharacterized protein n=1 Tax=Idiomarina abyssalis TaxID=86102 RepID=A0A8I1KFB0_9GAMM|nr:hypothetical protein [Idiomarina abyssalis]MBJ7265540.1 hypothetical protein [Idiomarina abyssalis]MBJ7316786.1 hypothetical protein [Idiomarina abyssalis]
MDIQPLRMLDRSRPVVVSDGSKRPSARHRHKLRNWTENNFRGRILRVTDDAVQIENLDRSSGHCHVKKWFSAQSPVEIRGATIPTNRRVQ